MILLQEIKVQKSPITFSSRLFARTDLEPSPTRHNQLTERKLPIFLNMDHINERHFGQDEGHIGLRSDVEGRKAHTETLEHIRSASSVNMSPELFEKLYLSPQNAVRGDLRRVGL